MAAPVYTDSQRARAAILVENAKTWTHGTRKSDGLAFVLFPSSKPGHAYYTSADGSACTCPSYFFRGACSHALACKMEAERLAAIDEAVEIAFMELALSKRGNSAGAALIKTYEQIWQED